MIKAVIGLVAMGLCSLSWADEESAVRIEWKEPHKYHDIRGGREPQDRFQQRVLTTLGNYLQEATAKLLSADQSLALTIHNLDLAGDVTPMFSVQHGDIRVVRRVYPPSIDIEFKLFDSEGNVLAHQRDRVRDLGFLEGVGPKFNRTPLGYDRALLEQWVKDTLKPALKSALADR